MMQPVADEYMQIQALTRRFGDVTALTDVSFSVAAGELITFVGPSGAGKSTLLRLLAGLDTPTHGTIRYRTAITRDHPAILVFQDYLLFPHMTVFENVAFGLRSQRRRYRPQRSAIRERVMACLEQLGIGDKASAWPAQLSGGQRQRVALARAIVVEPRLLLLDEPFANLDRSLKQETAAFIRELQQRLGVTTVVVSHDLDESIAVSDRIGVIVDGRLHQIAPFDEVYFRPATLAVARMFGPVNVLPSSAPQRNAHAGHAGHVDRADFAEQVVPPHAVSAGHAERELVCARPEQLSLVPDVHGEGVIRELTLIGGNAHYIVDMGAWHATVRAQEEGCRVGDRVHLQMNATFCVGQLPAAGTVDTDDREVS